MQKSLTKVNKADSAGFPYKKKHGRCCRMINYITFWILQQVIKWLICKYKNMKLINDIVTFSVASAEITF